jgi:hypothetical protein
MQFDWKLLSTLDRAIVASAAVAFVAAFLPWYGASIGPFSASVDGWSAGFSGWAGALLLTAAGVLLVLRRSGATLTTGSVPPAVLIAVVSALGLLLVVIRWVSFPRFHGIDVGARYGIYLALIAGIGQVTATVLEMRAEQATPEVDAPAAPSE